MKNQILPENRRQISPNDVIIINITKIWIWTLKLNPTNFEFMTMTMTFMTGHCLVSFTWIQSCQNLKLLSKQDSKLSKVEDRVDQTAGRTC